MLNTEKMVALGRFMIRTAPRFQDDVKFNAWARVGQQLTELGSPFALKLSEFSEADVATMREAIAVVTGKQDMPQVMQPQDDQAPKRARKPRMTQVMRKPAKTASKVARAVKSVKKATKAVKATKTVKVAKATKTAKASKAVKKTTKVTQKVAKKTRK
jgi:hypothetical protein